ncbi:MAG: hypothetical protein WBQ14_01515 [Gaiellaceae bacterium]
MNDLRDFCKPRQRKDRIALVVTLAISLLAIAALPSGCGSTKAKGFHGTSIAYVKVNPSGRTLHQGVVSIIRLRSNTAFVVAVENDGDYPEHNVKVALLIKQKPQSIRKSLTIGQIRRGAIQEVVFKGLNVTELANVISIKVNVTPVGGETNLVNNSATYEVRFSF